MISGGSPKTSDDLDGALCLISRPVQIRGTSSTQNQDQH